MVQTVAKIVQTAKVIIPNMYSGYKITMCKKIKRYLMIELKGAVCIFY